MKPLKTSISITLDSDIVEVLRTLAEEDDRSLSQYINIVLRKHLKSINQDSTDKQILKINSSADFIINFIINSPLK